MSMKNVQLVRHVWAVRNFVSVAKGKAMEPLQGEMLLIQVSHSKFESWLVHFDLGFLACCPVALAGNSQNKVNPTKPQTFCVTLPCMLLILVSLVLAGDSSIR